MSEQIAYVEERPPKEAIYARSVRQMHPALTQKLVELGLSDLYVHQARAYDALQEGKDVVVVTGTNSGKTLCYNLASIQLSLVEPAARCLYLFPTKALAQDQLGRLEALSPGPHLKIGTYDGDTSQTKRASVRRNCHVVLTNPDMLHVGILPGHEHWAKFLKSLRLVVLDELHVYRGVFGSHVGNVLRRLFRLCEFYRNRPQVVACSATIGNPTALFERLTGRKGTLIDEDGSPSGRRTFVFWNPPELGNGQRLSANVATSEILASLTEAGQRTLAFSRARVSAELVLRYTRKRVAQVGKVPENHIESYRAGYTPKERRSIEQALFKGKLLGLSATNAMELGVDVGALDAVILNGYPGTASSFWQQIGRAGRGRRDGLAVFVAHDDPLEQFFIRQPRTLLDARNESVGANPENPFILAKHLKCAAHERPISPLELDRFGPTAIDVAEAMDRSGELNFRLGAFTYPLADPPALDVNLRGVGSEVVRLMLEGQEFGTMERSRAMTTAHEGAIYLHRGSTFLVTALDLDDLTATLEPVNADYYTQSIVQSVIAINRVIRDLPLGGRASAALSGINVTETVEGYRRKSLDGDTVLGTEVLDLPSASYDTLGVRLDLLPLDEQADVMAQLGGVHGLEHALLAVAPFMAGCDRGDLGSAWYSVYPDTLRPAVFVFDKAEGGVGLSERLYESMPAWLSAAHQLLTSCPCEGGCPACLLSPRCEAGNEVLNKPATLALLHRLRAW